MEKIIKQAARGLRTSLTPTEKILWARLRYKQLEGCKFRRQQPLGKFIADFVCLEKRLIIELDGGHHALQKERDNERDNFLKESGYKILRFWNAEIEKDLDSVLERIRGELR
jgi:very-short-patch-repair endonuclease